jgi:hypothetical protein
MRIISGEYDIHSSPHALVVEGIGPCQEARNLFKTALR